MFLNYSNILFYSHACSELKRASGQLQTEDTESQVIFLDSALSSDEQAALRSHLVRRERYEGELEEEEFGEASGDADQLEQSWAEMSVSRPKTSAGVAAGLVPPPAQSLPPAASQPHPVEMEVSRSVPLSSPPRQSMLSSSAAFVAPSQSNIQDDVEALINANYPKKPLVSSESRNDANRTAAAHTQPTIAKEVPCSSSTGQSSTRNMVSAPCKVLRLDLESTWGDASYVGLSGLEVLVGPSFAPLRIGAHQLRAHPKDLSDIGCYDDPRVLANLVNGINNTADDTLMWIIPFTKGSEHYIEIDLLKVCDVVGIRVWNYNKSTEQVLRGCRQVSISADGRPLCQCLLRMGPGSDGVVFGQTILFSDMADILQGSASSQHAPPSRLRPGQHRETRLTTYLTPAVRQDFETPLNPTGLLWKFTFFDNWNDGYYIGLDALEFFDAAGRLIDTAALGAQVQATPYSVQDLAATQGSAALSDPRIPSQLLSRPAVRAESPEACWLAPLARCMTPAEKAASAHRALQGAATKGSPTSDSAPSFPLNNVLYVLFQHPVTVSAIRFENCYLLLYLSLMIRKHLTSQIIYCFLKDCTTTPSPPVGACATFWWRRTGSTYTWAR